MIRHDRPDRSTPRILALAACLAASLLAPDAAQAGPTLGDVFYINMENHNFTQPSGDATAPQPIFGNPAASFQNSLLNGTNPISAQVSYASNYHNVLATPTGAGAPSIHPSEPNYVWQEAGLAGPLNDANPYPNNIVNAPNLRGLLQNAGVSWKSYQEGIDLAKDGQGNLTNTVLPQNQWTVPLTSFSGTSPSYVNPYNGSNQYNYASKHEGSLFFTATNGGNDPTPSNPEAKYYAPLEQLKTDLANNTVARYNVITPDQYNDSHSVLANGFTYNGVHYTGDAAAIAQGDNFLSILIPQIMASQAYQNNGAIVIWWDETEGTNANDYNHTLEEIVISKLAKGNDYVSTLNYTHSSDLKTLQELYGVTAGGFLGDAASATTNDLSDLLVPGAIPVPEPSSVVMLGLGLAGAVTFARRRLARKSA